MKSRLYILIAAIWLIPWAAHPQVRSRTAGLGNNAEYMQLVETGRILSSRKDSLDKAITLLREEFRTNSGGRADFSAEIVRLENELFEVSGQADAVAAKIRAMDEVVTAANPENASADSVAAVADPPPPTVKQSANLAAHDVFHELLPEKDRAALLRAQSQERLAADMAARYIKNHSEIEKLAAAYTEASEAGAADSIFTLFLTLDRRNKAISDSLGNAWHDIYDDKLFAYNYLLQSRNQTRILSRLEASGRDARDEIADRRGDTASEEVSEYFARKKHLLEYEKAVAELLGQTAAADSLNRAAETSRLLIRPLPKINLEERYFIEYHDVSFRNPAVYTSSNPIPEATVYRRGLIYRIRIGSYTAKQAVSVFKGAYPLGYLNESGKWNYYTGGFADLGGAKAALADLVKRGFRNARIVVWNEGESLELDDTPSAAKTFRVEIVGAQGGLPESVREAIREVGKDADIALSEGIFIVAPFPTSLESETVADAVRKADPSLSVRTKSNSR